MKELKKYITEKLYTNNSDAKVLNDLTVKYNGPSDLYLQVPEKMSESDIQIYLDDTLLSKLPAEAKERDFGKNAKNIVDTYFEYERMEVSNAVTQKADILWDEHYDQSMNGVSMQIVKITNIQYVIVFTTFELVDVDDDEVNDTLYKLFNGLIEKNDNIPFELVLNKDNITYTEEKK